VTKLVAHFEVLGETFPKGYNDAALMLNWFAPPKFVGFWGDPASVISDVVFPIEFS
jgi:hypothetical protein